MQFIYWLLMLISLGYVLVKKRRFDFYSIAVLSTFIYYYPALLGSIKVSGEFVPVSTTVYLCLCVHIIVLTVCMICQDLFCFRKTNLIEPEPCDKVNKTEYTAMLIVSVAGLAFLAYTFAMYGGFQGDFNKMQLLANANRLTEYMKYIALFSFVYAFSLPRKYGRLIKLVSLVLIGYTFLLGHRSFVVIGIIALFVKKLSEDREEKPMYLLIKKYWGLFLFMAVCAIIVLFVKNVFAALMTGQYELVISRLTDPEYYLNSLLSSEANTIVSNLQSVCDSGMTHSFKDYIFIVFALIPFIGSRLMTIFDITSFETALNQAFNSRLDEGVGMGCTFLGEGYATGWFIFLIISLIGVFLFISFLQNRKKYTKSLLNETWIGIILVYFTFYIHRNSIFFLLVMARAYAYIWFLTWVIKKTIEILFRKKIYPEDRSSNSIDIQD